METFKIMHDYGAHEGFKFYDEKDFHNVEDAVKFAVGLNYSTPFIIVKVVWEPTR